MPQTISQALFIDLAKLTDGKPFDGMAPGEFTGMRGDEFELELEEFPVFVENTLENIEATRTESGELVGLPIDAMNHEQGKAAGWIVDVQQVGEIIRFTPKWTEFGIELIESGEMRFFSPTFHLKKKVIVGGSLTNWPATRDENEKIKLRPIELSQGLQAIDQEKRPGWIVELSDTLKGIRDLLTGKGDEADPEEKPNKDGEEIMDMSKLTDEQLTELKAQVLTEAIGTPTADLAEVVNTKAKELAESMFTQAIEAEQRKSGVQELCAKLVGGTEEDPQGLPVQRDDLEAFMLSLDETQQKQAEGLLTKIHDNGLVNFQEKGHGKKQTDMAELPEYIVKQLDEGKLKVTDLSQPMLAKSLGDLKDYDLSKWQEA